MRDTICDCCQSLVTYYHRIVGRGKKTDEAPQSWGVGSLAVERCETQNQLHSGGGNDEYSPQHFVSRETKSSPFEQERVNPSKRRFSSKRFNACMSEVFSALCGISMALEAWDIETVTIDVNANDLERWLASDREFQKQFNTLIRRLRGHAAAVVPQAATAHTNGDLIQ